MLRCKVCNEKGATMGCVLKTCKKSFHLPCARATKCALQVCSPCMFIYFQDIVLASKVSLRSCRGDHVDAA